MKVDNFGTDIFCRRLNRAGFSEYREKRLKKHTRAGGRFTRTRRGFRKKVFQGSVFNQRFFCDVRR
jgi:hypothetical protein